MRPFVTLRFDASNLQIYPIGIVPEKKRFSLGSYTIYLFLKTILLIILYQKFLQKSIMLLLMMLVLSRANHEELSQSERCGGWTSVLLWMRKAYIPFRILQGAEIGSEVLKVGQS